VTRYGYNLKSTLMLAAMTAQSTAVRMNADDRSDALDDDAVVIDSVQSGATVAAPATRQAPQGNRAQRRAQMRRK
jgi:hypothetical protein